MDPMHQDDGPDDELLDDDDEFDDIPPLPPTFRPLSEVLAEHAERGDIEGVLKVFGERRTAGRRFDQLQQALQLAADNAARQDPAGFAMELCNRMASSLATILLRAHGLVRATAAQADAWDPMRPSPDTLPLLENLLPRVEKIHKSLIDVLLAQASIARRWRLAGARVGARAEGVAGETRGKGRPGAAARDGVDARVTPELQYQPCPLTDAVDDEADVIGFRAARARS